MADTNDDTESGPLDAFAKSVDQYEYIAVIIPGATLLFGLALVVNNDILSLVSDISIGAIVIFLIAAYVVGQLVRAIGEAVEFAMWPLGMPTDWIPGGALVDAALVEQHLRRVLRDEQFKLNPYSDKTRRDAWRSIVRLVNAIVAKTTRIARVDAFNRTYGLMVGITVALIIDAILLLLTQTSVFGVPAPWPAAIAAVAALVALLRARHFGRIYGRELFVQFLSIQPPR